MLLPLSLKHPPTPTLPPPFYFLVVIIIVMSHRLAFLISADICTSKTFLDAPLVPCAFCTYYEPRQIVDGTPHRGFDSRPPTIFTDFSLIFHSMLFFSSALNNSFLIGAGRSNLLFARFRHFRSQSYYYYFKRRQFRSRGCCYYY